MYTYVCMCVHVRARYKGFRELHYMLTKTYITPSSDTLMKYGCYFCGHIFFDVVFIEISQHLQ